MIDFIKIKVIDCDLQRLSDHPVLEFNRTVSEKTGLMDTKAIAVYHCCKITVYDSGLVIFSGSIHKMHNSLTGIKAPKPNGNGFNGNPFYWDEIEFALQHLLELFQVHACQMQIQQIEYGINLILSFDPQDFISGLLMHLGKSFEFRYGGFYAQVLHSEYRIKVYNKGDQYDMNDKILRFEIHIKKMRFQKSEVGIDTIADIVPKNLVKVFPFLIKSLNQVLYYDITIQTKLLPKKWKRLSRQYDNPNFWKELSRKERNRNRKKLERLINSESQNLKNQLKEIIEGNWVRFHRNFNNRERVRFHTSNIVEISPIQHYLNCPITGLSLEHEKKGAKYAKTSTLKNLKKSDPGKYNEVCSLLLSNTKGNSPKFERGIISHLAKQIRNRYYNPNPIKQIGYNRKSVKGFPTLF